MTISQAVQHFHAKRAGKGKYTAKCPSHDDRSRNTLNIREGTRGVLIHCWAGCPTEAVLAAAGLRFSDLFYHSRDVSSEALKKLRRQQALDKWYEAERRIYDVKMLIAVLSGKSRVVRSMDDFGWILWRFTGGANDRREANAYYRDMHEKWLAWDGEGRLIL